MTFQNIVIQGSGKSVPAQIIDGNYFKDHSFFLPNGDAVEVTGVEAAEKLQTITGIAQRRYAREDQVASDLAYEAGKIAIEDAGIDPETIDLLIVGQNYGDISYGSNQTDNVPSVACRVKHLLGIQNPNCQAFDVISGCPGWIQGVIQAYASMKAGLAKRALVIGADTLSRMVDEHDRDTMIFADGAGAIVFELVEEEQQRGILSIGSKSYTKDEVYYLFNGGGIHPNKEDNQIYIKMHGRKIYEFALTHVPPAMKEVFDASGYPIGDLKKIFIHQANEKMDEAIVKRFYRAYKTPVPEAVMPMNISSYGNSSVATIPTLFDMVKRGELEGHQVEEGDLMLFASVGAGMNVNAFSYKH